MTRLPMGLAFALALLATPALADGLEVSGAYVPAPPPGAPAAMYATVINHGEEPATLVGATAEGFASAMLHATVSKDGGMSMHHAEAFTIAPGETLALEPHGNHLMLMRPDAPLDVGATVSGTFVLEDGASVPFTAQVMAPGHQMKPMRHGHSS